SLCRERRPTAPMRNALDEAPMELPFQESGWDSEARELIAQEGCTVEGAVESVTFRYLRDGDCRPLGDSALRGHIHGPKVMVLVAAMLDPKHRTTHSARLRYRFGFRPVRRTGRPKRAQNSDAVNFILAVLLNGVRKLANGEDPGRVF